MRRLSFFAIRPFETLAKIAAKVAAATQDGPKVFGTAMIWPDTEQG
jgi:hypothetical protein